MNDSDNNVSSIYDVFACDRCGLRFDEGEASTDQPDVCHACADAMEDGQPWPGRDEHLEIEEALRAIVVLRQAIDWARSRDWTDRQMAMDKMRTERCAAMNRLNKARHHGASRRVIRLEEEIRALASAMAITTDSLDARLKPDR
jgi:hypothetical protein